MILSTVEPVPTADTVTRYEAVNRALDLVALGHRQKIARQTRSDLTAINAEINASFDALLAFLLLAFPGEPPRRTRVNAIFAAGEHIGALDYRTIEQLDADLVPVAVMREICHVHRVRFSPEQVPHWRAFMARYKSAIVG